MGNNEQLQSREEDDGLKAGYTHRVVILTLNRKGTANMSQSPNTTGQHGQSTTSSSAMGFAGGGSSSTSAAAPSLLSGSAPSLLSGAKPSLLAAAGRSSSAGAGRCRQQTTENLPPRTLARVARDVRDLVKSPPEGVRLVLDEETGMPDSLSEILVSIRQDAVESVEGRRGGMGARHNAQFIPPAPATPRPEEKCT